MAAVSPHIPNNRLHGAVDSGIELVLGGISLARGTARRGRALLGLALGVADLAVLAVLVTADGTVSWPFGL